MPRQGFGMPSHQKSYAPFKYPRPPAYIDQTFVVLREAEDEVLPELIHGTVRGVDDWRALTPSHHSRSTADDGPRERLFRGTFIRRPLVRPNISPWVVPTMAVATLPLLRGQCDAWCMQAVPRKAGHEPMTTSTHDTSPVVRSMIHVHVSGLAPSAKAAVIS